MSIEIVAAILVVLSVVMLKVHVLISFILACFAYVMAPDGIVKICATILAAVDLMLILVFAIVSAYVLFKG